MDVVTRTDIPGLKKTSGKVRDIYRLEDVLLLVSTDRISAYDSVLPQGIPGKGMILNRLSEFWFNYTEGVVDNHFLTADVAEYPAVLHKNALLLRNRSMLVKMAERVDIECVARGYLVGSGWREYRESGSIAGVDLPSGLVESSRLPEPIFTPATKAATGHDENISFEAMVELVGHSLADRLRQLSLEIYAKASVYAEEKGIIIADTKFEFGLIDGEVLLIDELLTPDSSRFWPQNQYKPGGPQMSYDKQLIRDYLDELGWDHSPPAPSLPDEVIEKTQIRYEEVYTRLSGLPLPY